MKIDNISNASINKIASKPLNPKSSQIINRNDSRSFMNYLSDALKSVNDLQTQSDKTTQMFISGITDNIHQVMIDSEKAEIALQFTMQIRNKILDAYNEIMRMQI